MPAGLLRRRRGRTCPGQIDHGPAGRGAGWRSRYRHCAPRRAGRLPTRPCASYRRVQNCRSIAGERPPHRLHGCQRHLVDGKRCVLCWRNPSRQPSLQNHAQICRGPTRARTGDRAPTRKDQNRSPSQTQNQSTSHPTGSSMDPTRSPRCRASHTSRRRSRAGNNSRCHKRRRRLRHRCPNSPGCSPRTPPAESRRKPERRSGNATEM